MPPTWLTILVADGSKKTDRQDIVKYLLLHTDIWTVLQQHIHTCSTTWNKQTTYELAVVDCYWSATTVLHIETRYAYTLRVWHEITHDDLWGNMRHTVCSCAVLCGLHDDVVVLAAVSGGKASSGYLFWVLRQQRSRTPFATTSATTSATGRASTTSARFRSLARRTAINTRRHAWLSELHGCALWCDQV